MHRSLALIAAASIAVASVGCVRTQPRGDVGNGPANGAPTVVFADDNTFSPRTIHARAGRSLLVEVHNEGNAHHDFTVDAVRFSTGDIGPGKVIHGRFTVLEGRTLFHCHYHRGMTGTIVGTS